MKFNFQIILLLILITFSCKNNNQKHQNKTSEIATTEVIKEVNVLKSSTYITNVTKKVQNLIGENNFTHFNQLQMQKLDRIEENSEVIVNTSTPILKNGNQMYYHLKESTLYIGSSYLCDRCPEIHLNNASGFVIHEEGVIVTNYHVIEVKDNINVSAIFAADSNGNVYPVSKILAASQSNDLAILQLDTKGTKLKALPMAEEESMGETIYMMGHPYNNLFFMTKGIVSRKYLSERDSEVKIAVTTEFGQGASGGPIVNEHGQVVAMVAGVQPHNASGNQGPTLMVSREAIPVSVLNKYIRKP
ncbi:serine protease [Lutibacter sp. A64]|uniref:S1 family peptidase n=1 Tax=Lutibacter sp. A64 TaxID=2918526 RepID=UPI001F06E453|nr:serine protease [Lutibacter sp. A64]UMB52505.1 serine protease [Lutibacter sp. A64]